MNIYPYVYRLDQMKLKEKYLKQLKVKRDQMKLSEKSQRTLRMFQAKPERSIGKPK